jgi:Tol biopolymer transport system component
MVAARPVATLTGGGAYSHLRWSPDDQKIAFLEDMKVMVLSASGGKPVRAADVTVQGFAWVPDNSGLIVSARGELWFIPRAENGSRSQLTFGELSYESPDISAGGNLVVSRRSLYGPDSDIVMFTGLKW